MRWSVFCRVVDNYGDVGVAWRLAADLAGRGEQVRLVIDDASALAWMAPHGAAGVAVVPWSAPEVPDDDDVWIETFGCGWPDAASSRLAHLPDPPVCIDVEHLSAEAFVARSHGLPLPRFAASGKALSSWCFYPGFDAQTGGLLREPGLCARRTDAGAGRAWLASMGIDCRDDERRVSLFCYGAAPLEAMLSALADRETLLLLSPGAAPDRVLPLLAGGLGGGRVRAERLPWLSQDDYDALLRTCDLNVVRGEDSFVRAMWAAKPFVWQAYPQDDAAHLAKVAAFLGLFLTGAKPTLAASLRQLHSAWNAGGDAHSAAPLTLPDAGAWAMQCERWRDHLCTLPDLTTSLLRFAASKR